MPTQVKASFIHSQPAPYRAIRSISGTEPAPHPLPPNVGSKRARKIRALRSRFCKVDGNLRENDNPVIPSKDEVPCRRAEENLTDERIDAILDLYRK
jgi:hypothetical protein